MKPKLKTIIITALFAASVNILAAQDKYEFITVFRSGANLMVAAADTIYKYTYTPYDLKHQLKMLNQLSVQGWEVYAASDRGLGEGFHTYFLRRKIKEK